MPDIREISQPLSDRPLKYGRNVAAISSAIIVLAQVDKVTIFNFSAFGFTNVPESTLWAFLWIVVAYYLVTFLVNARVDYQHWVNNNVR